MWDLIVSVPDHCLSFYFILITLEAAEMNAYRTRQVEYTNCLSENLRHPSRT